MCGTDRISYTDRMTWVVPLLLLILFEGIADIFSKEWSLHGHPARWTAAIAGYVVANTFWLFALRDGAGLTRGSMIFSVGSAMVAVVIGAFWYRESLSHIESIGLGLGVLALVFLFWNA